MGDIISCQMARFIIHEFGRHAPALTQDIIRKNRHILNGADSNPATYRGNKLDPFKVLKAMELLLRLHGDLGDDFDIYMMGGLHERR